MANEAKVIDITAALEARRAAHAEAQQMQRLAFEVLLPVPEEAPARFVPAYSDASNERRGAKYERGLSTKEIAARVRADIKAATGTSIPKGTKVSVRYDSFSGGSAIRIVVTAVPAGFAVLNADRVRFDRDQPHAVPNERDLPRHTAQASALLNTITAIASAYHRDNSDTSVDFFDVNFYGDARFAWELESAERAALLASTEVAS